MKKILFLLLSVLVLSAYNQKQPNMNNKKAILVIHGGAGTILKKNMTPEKEEAYRQKLTEALMAGQKVLNDSGTSTDAVIAAIEVLENSPLFNAGKGSVFTHHETNEMDASIMEGKTKNAGATAGIRTVKNPIKLAFAIMTKSEHVMLSGKGAEEFAELMGLEIVDSSYFYDENRYKQLKKVQESDRSMLDHDSDKPINDSSEIEFNIKLDPDDKKFGTVGAVALDKFGNLAAGTSTGGMTNKKYGRIGDSPVIGAGTYADDSTCAVSCTGHGEYFIRYAVAFDLHAKIKYEKKTLLDAAKEIIHQSLKTAGGSGGLIALDKNGNFAMVFNTAGMYRAVLYDDGTIELGIYND